jgi:hypothetical protein
MTPQTTQFLALAAGGVIGTGLRALLDNSQTTLSRKTVADLVIGGLIGGIYPVLLPSFVLGDGLVQQGAFIALVSAFAGQAIQSFLGEKINSMLGQQQPTVPPKPPEPPKP